MNECMGDKIEHEEIMTHTPAIWFFLKKADEKTKEAFGEILDGYEQFNHL